MSSSKVVVSLLGALLIIVGVLATSHFRRTTEVKIGVILPLTGPLAEYGEAIRNGMTLAQEDAGGKKLTLVFEDSSYAPDKAVAAFRKLSDFDGVRAVVNFGAPTSEAIAPLTNQSSVPFLSMSIVNGLSSPNKAIRLLDQPNDFVAVLWPYMRAQGWKKIGVVVSKNQFLEGMYDSLVAEKHDDETVVIVDSFQGGDKDFRTSIQKAKSLHLDAIGNFLLSGQVSQYAKQSKELGLDLPVVGTDFFDGEKEIAAASGAMEGAVYPDMLPSQAFHDRYVARFGSLSQIPFAGSGYDTIRILSSSVDNASPETILRSIQALKGYDGVLGRYDYIETANDRYLKHPVYLKVVKNGKPVAY